MKPFPTKTMDKLRELCKEEAMKIYEFYGVYPNNLNRAAKSLRTLLDFLVYDVIASETAAGIEPRELADKVLYLQNKYLNNDRQTTEISMPVIRNGRTVSNFKFKYRAKPEYGGN